MAFHPDPGSCRLTSSSVVPWISEQISNIVGAVKLSQTVHLDVRNLTGPKDTENIAIKAQKDNKVHFNIHDILINERETAEGGSVDLSKEDLAFTRHIFLG
jgi:hypothetical protein